MRNFADTFSYYKDYVLKDMEYTSNTEAENDWTQAGIADDVNAVNNPSGVSSTGGFAVGRGLVHFSTTTGAGTATFTSSFLRRDLTEIVGAILGAPTKGKIRVMAGFETGQYSTVTALKIRVGSDSSNYIEWLVCNPSATSMNSPIGFEVALTDGAITVTGSPDWKQADYVAVIIDRGSNFFDSDLYMTGLAIVPDEGVTQGIWSEDVDQATFGKVFNYLQLGRQGRPTMSINQNSAGKIIRTVMNPEDNTMREFGDKYTLSTAFSNDLTLPDIGFAFCVQDATESAQNCYIAYVDDQSGTFKIDKIVNGSVTNLASQQLGAIYIWEVIQAGRMGYMKLEKNGSSIKVYASAYDDSSFRLVCATTDSTFDSGGVGLYISNGGSPTVTDFYEFKAYCEERYAEFNRMSFHDRLMVRLDNIQEFSAPSRDIDIMDIAKSNRRKYISHYHKGKFVRVTGEVYVPGNRVDFIKTLDDMKMHLREEGILRIGQWNGETGIFETRDYKDAIVINLDDAFNAEYINKEHLKFSLIFEVPEGVSYKSNIEFYAKTFQESYNTDTIFFKGSASPRPIIRISMSDVTPASGGVLDTVSIVNFETGRMITATKSGGFTTNGYFTVDFQDQSVKWQGAPLSYEGSIDDSFFVPGANRLAFHMYRESDIILSNDAPNNGGFVTDELFGSPYGYYYAQSFTAPSTVTVAHADLLIAGPGKEFKFMNKVTLQLRANNAGLPDSSATTSVNVEINNKEFEMVRLGKFSPSLTSGTLYWLVVVSSGRIVGAQLVGHRLKGTNQGNFAGSLKITQDQGNNWYDANTNYDLCFRLYGPDPTGITATVEIQYKPRDF